MSSKAKTPDAVMRAPAGERLADALEEEALAQLAELKQERERAGRGDGYYKLAKVVLGVTGAAVRLLATLENRRTNDIGVTRVAPPAALWTGK